MLAASGFKFPSRKTLILGTYTDVYKATAYSRLLMGYCNKNYSREQKFFLSLFSTLIVFTMTDAKLQAELAESKKRNTEAT